jgi:hypothetical protein
MIAYSPNFRKLGAGTRPRSDFFIHIVPPVTIIRTSASGRLKSMLIGVFMLEREEDIIDIPL